MDKIKYVKLEQSDGSYSDSIPLAVDSDYVDVNGNTLTNELNNKATKDEVQAVASGSPAEVYTTVEALITADPNHSKIYVVTADGHWYYYKNNQWTDGGKYQAAEDSDTVNKIKENLDNLIDSERLEKTYWDMTDFSGWPSASNAIYVYSKPVKKGNYIVSIELQNSPDYHDNGSVYLLKKMSNTQYSKIKEISNISQDLVEIDYMCDEDIYIAISGEYNTNVTTQSGYEPMIELNNDFSFNVNCEGFSLTSKLIIEQIKNNTFFDVGDGCTYADIQSAINGMPANSIIHVKNGVYNLAIDSRTKNQTIIGESKENCIIQFTNKTYGDSPVYIGIGIWKNLTFKMLKDENAESYSRISNLTPQECAYAVHIDHFADDREIIFENCNFYSELNRAIGIGLKRNVTVKFVRCNIISTNNISALFCHDCEYDYFGDNQVLFLDTCNVIAKGCQYAFTTEDRNHSDQGNKMYYRFYRNMFYSEINGKTNIIETIGASGNKWEGTSVVTLTGDSFGNNLTEMNA